MAQLRHRLRRDDRHLRAAREQALDLLEPDRAGADDEARPPRQVEARHVERLLEHRRLHDASQRSSPSSQTQGRSADASSLPSAGAAAGRAATMPHGRAPPLRPRAVLRAPLRLLRLRHGDGPRAPARAPTWTRSWPSSRRRRDAGALAAESRRCSSAAGRRRCFARTSSAACSTPCRRRPSGRWSATRKRSTPELARRARGARRARLARRAELPGAAARRAGAPRDARGGRGAVATLRAAGVANLSLDMLFGIPGETPGALDADLDELLALAPEHCSLYELEAKPGTRFTHAHGAALARQAELLEEHYERRSARMEAAGYAWYETANFCRARSRVAPQPAPTGVGRDYLGIGVGAVSTLGDRAPRERAAARALPRRRDRAASPRRRGARTLDAGDARRGAADARAAARRGRRRARTWTTRSTRRRSSCSVGHGVSPSPTVESSSSGGDVCSSTTSSPASFAMTDDDT